MIIILWSIGSYFSYFQKTNKKTILVAGVNKKDVLYVLLVAVDEDTKTMQPIHISRNTICKYNDLDSVGRIIGTKTGKIRNSYKGVNDELLGLINIKDAVCQLFDNVRIDYYATIDLSHIADITQVFEGIEITINEDYTDLDPTYTKGTTFVITPEGANQFVIGDESKESVDRIEKRTSAYVDGLFEYGQYKHHDDEEYFERKYAEITKYCLFNSNDIIYYAGNVAEYVNLPVISLSGQNTADGKIIDQKDIDDICLSYIYN